jgi:hypothetical protein
VARRHKSDNKDVHSPNRVVALMDGSMTAGAFARGDERRMVGGSEFSTSNPSQGSEEAYSIAKIYTH